MTVRTQHSQSLIDIAVQQYGSEWASYLPSILERNNLSLAQELEPGTTLDLEEPDGNDLSLQYLKARGIKIASGQYILVNEIPFNLEANTVSDDQIDLTWDYNGSASFILERSTLPGSGFSTLANIDSQERSYFDNEVNTGTTYYYRITTNGVDFSDIASATTLFALVFETNIYPSLSSGAIFNPSMIYEGLDTPKWVFQNGYIWEGNQIIDEDGSLTGLDGVTQTVKIIVQNHVLIKSINFSDIGLTGTFNASLLTGISQDFDVRDNELTTVVLPSSMEIDGRFALSGNSLSGTVNLSAVEFVGTNCTLWLHNNAFTEVVPPAIFNGSIQDFNLSSNSLSGLLDLSVYTFSSSSIQIQNNAFTSVNFGSGTHIDSFKAQNNDLSSIDFSQCSFTGSSITIQLNNNVLSSIIMPASMTGNVTSFYVQQQALKGGAIGVLDLEGVRWGANTSINLNNSGISEVIFDDSSSFDLRVFQGGQNVFSSIDLSMFTWTENCTYVMHDNPTLNTMKHPAGTANFYQIRFDDTGLSSLDFSNWGIASREALSDRRLLFNNCPNLETVYLPNPVGNALYQLNGQGSPIKTISFSVLGDGAFDRDNCLISFSSVSWSVAEVNKYLVEIDAIINPGFTNRVLLLNGSNAAPDASSGGYNGTAAVASLVSKGFTVTTS